MEKVITIGVKVKKLPATTRNLYNIRLSVLEKILTSVTNVEKFLAVSVISVDIEACTLGKIRMRTVTVRRPSVRALTSVSARGSTLARNLSYAAIVGSALEKS